jgi:hypothetical protein
VKSIRKIGLGRQVEASSDIQYPATSIRQRRRTRKYGDQLKTIQAVVHAVDGNKRKYQLEG